MRFSMLYSGEQILSFKLCLVFYAGDSLRNRITNNGVVNFIFSILVLQTLKEIASHCHNVTR